jgi:hypothetical protein
MRHQSLLAALLGISFVAGCSDDSGPTGPPPSVFPQTIQGSVSGASALCVGQDDDYGELEFPCERFSIVTPRSGTLVARLTWPDPTAHLLLGSGSPNLSSCWNPCSASGCESRIFVRGDGATNLSVALTNVPAGTQSRTFQVDLTFY